MINEYYPNVVDGDVIRFYPCGLELSVVDSRSFDHNEKPIFVFTLSSNSYGEQFLDVGERVKVDGDRGGFSVQYLGYRHCGDRAFLRVVNPKGGRYEVIRAKAEDSTGAC